MINGETAEWVPPQPPSDSRLHAMAEQIKSAWDCDADRFIELMEAAEWLLDQDLERLYCFVRELEPDLSKSLAKFG